MQTKLTLFSTSNVGSLETKKLSGLPEWAFYTLGVLFIILGLISFGMYIITKRKAEEYKKKQIIQYKIKYRIPDNKPISYESTKMFLPAWEIFKLFAPIFIGLIFLFIGISWLGGWVFNV